MQALKSRRRHGIWIASMSGVQKPYALDHRKGSAVGLYPRLPGSG